MDAGEDHAREQHAQEVYARIERRLDAVGLKPRPASLKAGLGPDAIRDIKRGKLPSSFVLKGLSRVLECSADYLLSGEPSQWAPAPPDEPDDELDAPADYVQVPTVSPAFRFGMGPGSYAENDVLGPPELMPRQLIERDLRGQGTDFMLLEVEGQSMAPLLLSGDRVIVDRRRRNPSQAGVFALWDGHGLVVKHLERVP
ncbi:MAG: helix-turn-helix transcriptional regulator, partial [Acidobacteriota bacterium]